MSKQSKTKPKKVLVVRRIRPTLLRFERTVPHDASFAALAEHKLGVELLKTSIMEVLNVMALSHSIIMMRAPDSEDDVDILAGQRRTRIRCAFLLAEGSDQKPGLLAAPPGMSLSQAFEYDTEEELASAAIQILGGMTTGLIPGTPE